MYMYIYIYTCIYTLAAAGKQSANQRASSVLQCVAVSCNTLQLTATHCNSLQHNAIHCNTHTGPQMESNQLINEHQVCCNVLQ